MALVPAPAKLEKLHITVFVHGDAYLELFRRLVLPNLATLIDEIPAELRPGARFRILTNASGVTILEQVPALARIRQMVAVDLADDMVHDHEVPRRRHGSMILNQERLLREASAVGAGIIFCPPDLIWSRGSFATIIKLAQQGIRAVIGPSARVSEEEYAPHLEARIARDDRGDLSISAADLIRDLFDHWQQMNDGFFWKQGSYYWKSYIYAWAGNRQFLIKFFQGPTMFAWPYKPIQTYKSWIDHRLIKQCARSFREIHVVADAHELMTVDITARDRKEELRLVMRPRWALFRQLIERHTQSRYNLLMGRYNCRVYDATLPEATWEAAERQFDRSITPLIYAALIVRPIMAIFSAIGRRLGVPVLMSSIRIRTRRITALREMVIKFRAFRDR